MEVVDKGRQLVGGNSLGSGSGKGAAAGSRRSEGGLGAKK